MANNAETSLPAHYERNLGPIVQGWSDKSSRDGIHVVSFASQPEAGVTTFATLGLSRFILKLSDDRNIRQEILISAQDSFSNADLASFLLSVAEGLSGCRQALLRGEVIGPASPIISGASVRAIYVTNPSPFNDSLVNFQSLDPPDTVFAYLIPITTNEAYLARDHGWQWFENELAQQDPDIWNLTRTEQVLCSPKCAR